MIDTSNSSHTNTRVHRHLVKTLPCKYCGIPVQTKQYIGRCAECKKLRISATSKSWYQNNRNRVRKYIQQYQQNKRKTNTSFRIRLSYAQRIKDALKHQGIRKNSKTVILLGCTIPAFKSHLESKFALGMNWNNYGYGEGKWVIDHIKPCASFNLSIPEEQFRCFNYTNLQPLWWIDNLIKSDNITP